MSEHFNKLTSAEAERLAMLAEECGEVVQIIGKILRHGYDSYHPSDDEKTPNREFLVRELSDIMAVQRLMEVRGDIERIGEERLMDALTRKKKFAHHQ